MKTILVSGASGVVGYGILRSLRQARSPCLLIATSIHKGSIAPAFCDHFELAPRTDDPSYLTWLLDTIRRYKVDMLIPGIEIDMHLWPQWLSQMASTGALPLINNPQLISLCADKWLFYERLLEEGAEYLIESSLSSNFSEISEVYGLPFILKPRAGFGSKGVVKILNESEFQASRAEIGEKLMVQPVVGCDKSEYTTSMFCDGEGGFFCGFTLRRELASEGYTATAEVASSEIFLGPVKHLCELFKPVGPTNFQFRLTESGPKLLEINPRVSSATSIRAAFGYNESEMSVDYFLFGRTPKPTPLTQGRAVRYIDERVFV